VNLCWHILRVEESRGFVSRRILPRITERQTLVYGRSYFISYGYFVKVLNNDEIFAINFK
jgi:hypothetical protein